MAGVETGGCGLLGGGGQTPARVLEIRRQLRRLGDSFLARRPGRFYSATQLITLAWGTPELSAEQLRTYIVRLRRRLSTAGAPCRVVSEPRRGYGLVFTL